MFILAVLQATKSNSINQGFYRKEKLMKGQKLVEKTLWLSEIKNNSKKEKTTN